MPTETNKLKIKLIQPTDMFADDAFNNVIKDLDNKVVGIAHLTSGAHWEVWTKDTKYAKGDIVRTTTCKSNQYFQCIVGGTSGKDEPKNQGAGAQITDNTATWIINEIGSSDSSNGGAVIFVGEKYYTKGQLAIFNGVLYRSIKDHVAKTTFQEDFESWQKLYSNIREWTDSTFYFSGEIVINNDKLYKCKQDHVSAGTFVSDINTWESLSSNGIETFKPSTYYNDGVIVVEGNRLYRCTLAHTSTADLISDIQNWELLSNIQEWESNKTYIQGNIVLYDHTPYKVIKNHVSNDFSLDKDNFEITYSNIRDFNASSYYKAGSYVLYDNNIYKALNDTKGDIGHKLQLQTSASFTDSEGVYTKEIGTDSGGYNLVTEPTGNYINAVIDLGSICDVTQVILSELISVNCAPNEIVVKTSKDGTDYSEADSLSTGGYSNFKNGTALNINKKVRYIKLVFKSVYKSNGNMFTLNKVEVYVSNPDWQKITNTQKPTIEAWTSNTDYYVNEVVIYNHKLYRCNIKNKGNKFDDVATNWQEITASNNIWMPSMYYDVGDTAIYDTMLYICRTANSDATFTPSNWVLVNEYYTIPQYEDNTEYKIGQLVFHDNKILKANQAVNDTAFDSTHWDIVYDSYILPWSANYQYYQNNICIYNNKLYRCINANKDATFTPSNWIRLSSGEIEDFKANHNYDENDVFKINNQLYSVKTKFTTTNSDISNYVANVEPLIADISKWASNTYYYQGMIVEYQYNLYKCETAHKSSTLFVDEDKSINTVYWKPLGKLNTQLEYYDSTKTYNINDCVLQKEDYGASKWVSGTTYKVDDTVVYNEIIYKCKTANSDTAFTDSNWEEINTEKTILYRCLKSTANAPSISSTEWEEIDCYIELASDKDIEDLFV